MKADPAQAHVARELEHDAPLIVCRFDPAGRALFAGAENNAVVRWDLASGTKTVFAGHEGWVFGLTFSPDGRTLISSGSDDQLLWWRADAEEKEPAPLRRVRAHEGWIRAVATSPDGLHVASAGNDRMVRLWNLEDGSAVRELAGHERDVYSLTFHPSGRWLVSGDLLGRVLVWNLETGAQETGFDAGLLHTLEQGQGVDYGGVRSLGFSADAAELACAGLHNAPNPLGAINEPLALRFSWETRELRRKHVSDGGLHGVAWRAQYHPDGFLIGCSGGSGGGFLLFWNGEQDGPFHQMGLPNTARELDLHPDGLSVAVAHYDRRARIVRLAAKEG